MAKSGKAVAAGSIPKPVTRPARARGPTDVSALRMNLKISKSLFMIVETIVTFLNSIGPVTSEK